MLRKITRRLEHRHIGGILWRLISSVVLLLSLFGTTLFMGAPSVSATSDPTSVSFTLQGCRNDGTITLPNGSGQFVCPDSAYTTGNLGKGWNELDLVPFRLTASAGNSAPSSQTYAVAVAVDNANSGKPGYDVLSTLTLNTALSTSGGANCQISVGPQTTLTPGVGGTDSSLYRILTITQPKNTNCVYDFYARLALGSHLYPGSSLHADLLNQNLSTQGVGSKDVSIPVKEIAPQSLNKDMAATEGADYAWNITKSATPAHLSFGNTCDTTQPLSQGVQVSVSWTKLPATLGAITVVSHVYATNPASRAITTTVTDVVYSGSTVLHTSAPTTVVVPANTANFLVMTDTITVPAGTTNLNDIATATYTDLVTGITIPGSVTATATAPVQVTYTNATATINDVESITGAGLTYSVDSFSGAAGAFDGGYVAGTATGGNVSWTSGTQSGSGSVTFNKTVYAAKGVIEPNGDLHDIATLTGSDGFSANATADVSIDVNTTATLTIEKTIPNILENGESATFTFHVKATNDPASPDVQYTSITFGAGQTDLTATITGLAPAVYYVFEDPTLGFTPAQNPITIDLSGTTCAGTAKFVNSAIPAHASVAKVSNPAGFEANWTFHLLDGQGNTLETVTTTGSGAVTFTTPLGEGSYSIIEDAQPGWLSDGGQGCVFTVNLPADATRVFACTFTNTYQPSITLQKTGTSLSKIGDPVSYTIALTNTSPTPGAAGAPSLVCTLSDPLASFSKDVTVAPQASDTEDVTFAVPSGAPDPLVNTATASCHYPGLTDVVVSTQAQASTNLFQPSVTVSKTGPAYAEVGDTITYNVTITDTSSSDSPNLVLDSFSDTKAGSVTPPAACNNLASGASCSFSYTYVVQPGDDNGQPGAQMSNTATVHYHPDGFTNNITNSSTWNVTLLHPSFTLAKICTTQTVPQAGPATFQVTIKNTGDADLAITASDGIGAVNLAAGASQTFNVTVNGPFAGQGTVSNTVNASATLASKYQLSDVVNTAPASASCTVDGLAGVQKTVQGGAVTQPQGSGFTFQLRQNAGTTSDGTILDTQEAYAGHASFTFSADLIPGNHYQVCEVVMPGWNTTLAPPAGGSLFVPNSITPPSLPNPDVNNMIVCADFVAAAGQTTTFNVDNAPPPGGRALTIGFWKNWASCSKSNGKGQKPVLDQTLALTEPGGLVVSAQSGTYPSFAPAIYLVLHGSVSTPNVAPGCQAAVNLLNKSTLSGKKMASDPAFNLAAQLVAAELNYAAGAGKTGPATNAINQAVLLLGKYQFNGNGYTGKISSADATTMNNLATILNNYNNDLP